MRLAWLDGGVRAYHHGTAAIIVISAHSEARKGVFMIFTTSATRKKREDPTRDVARGYGRVDARVIGWTTGAILERERRTWYNGLHHSFRRPS